MANTPLSRTMPLCIYWLVFRFVSVCSVHLPYFFVTACSCHSTGWRRDFFALSPISICIFSVKLSYERFPLPDSDWQWHSPLGINLPPCVSFVFSETFGQGVAHRRHSVQVELRGNRQDGGNSTFFQLLLSRAAVVIVDLSIISPAVTVTARSLMITLNSSRMRKSTLTRLSASVCLPRTAVRHCLA